MGIKDKTQESSQGLLFPPIRDFGGINTRDARTAIQDTEFAWIENVMPIGHGNAAVVPGPGSVEANIPAPSTTITYARYYSRSGGDFSFIFTADGRIFEFSHATNTLKQINDGTHGRSDLFTAPTIDQWKSERIVIVDPVKGFFDWDGTTLTLDDAGHIGTTIACYGGRVFIGNGRTVSFTDVNTYNSFAGAAGSFIQTEGKLRKQIYAFEAANNYLYYVGDSATYIVGDLAVSGGVTVLSNVNLTSEAGTLFRTGISTLERIVIIVNLYGVYALLGAQPKRLSAPLDGIYPNIDFTQAPSTCVSTLFGIQCFFVLFPSFNDNGTIRSLIAVYFDGKWFLASTTSNLKFIWHAVDNGTHVVYATTGTDIFHLFSSSTVQVPIKVKTKLYDFNDPYTDKMMVRMGLEAFTSQINNLTASVDTLQASTVLSSFNVSNTITWLNNNNQIVTWLNNSSQSVQWISGGNVLLNADAQGGGKYVGFTFTGNVAGLTFIGILGEYNKGARW